VGMGAHDKKLTFHGNQKCREGYDYLLDLNSTALPGLYDLTIAHYTMALKTVAEAQP
jgi:hypothetical protein